MSEIKVNSNELENLVTDLKTSLQNFNLSAVNLNSACDITCNAEGLVNYMQLLKEIKMVLSNYKLLVSMDVSQIEKSKKTMLMLDSRIGTSIKLK